MQTQVLAVVLALLAAAHGENFKKYDAAAVKRFSDELSRRGIVPPSLSRPHEPASRPDPAASAPAGDFEGRWTRSHFGRPIAAFEGIPYAQPPVGDLRFKVAKPLANRLADFKANKPGAMCVQHDMFGTKKLIGSEDCLFINVYVPEKVQRANGEKLPVMFFVHGGGYIFGQGDFYQSNVLLDKDVVLVTMNYRLGVLGFMTTEDDVIPANLGLKDQVAALRWVHDNIASFGGDPNLVTVFGHSAGSSSSQFLMLSPLSPLTQGQGQGLMHRVIAMSGSVFAPWALSRPGKMAEARRSKAEQLGCPPEPSRDFLACLQTKTAEEIYRQESVEMTISFMPVVEGDVPGAHIPHHPKKMLSDGPLNDVPYMTGVTSEEGLMFTAGWATARTIRSQVRLAAQAANSTVTWIVLHHPPEIHSIAKHHRRKCHHSNSSLRSLDVSLGSSNHSNSTRNNAAPTPPGHLNAQLCSAGQNSSPPDFYIIRVTVETDSAETDGIIMYKSIMLGNSERTPQVIRNAMLKLGLEGNPEAYTLSQVLPDRGGLDAAVLLHLFG